METNKNMFLIGFMGCGKSTMARLWSDKTGAELIEMDETIEAEAGMSINEIFEKYGENHFRDLESQLIERITQKGGAVVSCGGGVVTRKENKIAMKNGITVFLEECKDSIAKSYADADKLLEVTCFGKFTVFAKDRTPVRFERSKARELFAYLIHKKGGECTIREAAAVLFEDDPFDDKKQNYMQKIISSMMKSLRSCGAERVICKEFNSLSIDVDKVSCDYYRYIALGGDKVMMGDESYMQQYPWADYW
jgi:shikimate kinase